MKTLNIIGCGNVGKVLGRLFHEQGSFRVGDILNRSPESGAAAAAFIGVGRAVSGYPEMAPADCYLIAAGDDAIAGCAGALAASGLAGPGSVIFHASGALASDVLAPLRQMGGAVASVHPVLSFADPAAALRAFPGTWCGMEGDAPALELLSEAFASLGGRIFPVDPRFKAVYHAGSVLVCNYLAALMELGLRAYEKGGLPRQTALQVMEPLVRGTLDNILRVGPQQALSGPIARGDAAAVSRQLAALEEWDGEVAELYRSLGRVALSLARRKGEGASPGFDALAGVLAGKD